MGERTTRVDRSVDDADVAKVVQLLHKIQTYKRYLATVTKLISPGVLEVTVDGINLTKARCYITWAAGETYVENARIIVAVDDSGICFILPRELPRGPGKTKVVQAIDDSSPATLDLDFVRFNASVLSGFQDESNV